MVTRAEAQAALDAAEGNKTEAARALGIPRKTFSDQLERENIVHRGQDVLIQKWADEFGVPVSD
jgi:DNA-binding NtrC family response regulator